MSSTVSNDASYSHFVISGNASSQWTFTFFFFFFWDSYLLYIESHRHVTSAFTLTKENSELVWGWTNMNRSTVPVRNTFHEVCSITKSRGAKTWVQLKSTEVLISRAFRYKWFSLIYLWYLKLSEGRFIFAMMEPGVG